MINFEEMGFTPGILNAIRELGFEKPMPVQEQVIPLMLGYECDIVALAQTGTGKTAAFGLPLVQATDTSIRDTQALILCPTRELCIQIAGDLSDYAKYTGHLNIVSVYGGASIENQIKGLKKGAHIIVATPGRLIDLINRGAAKLASVNTVILDEADEMLNMGFLDSINEILASVPEQRRTLLFSATMSGEIAAIARNYMNDPAEVTIGKKNAAAENVSHVYYMMHAKDKYNVLKRLADSEPDIYGIVFCRTRKETQEVANRLIHDGYNADALHGELSQAQRDTVMQKFRIRNLQLLIATDVAARGLDVDDLTHVINFSLPEDTEVYTHRSGRTGRAGKTGVSVSLVHLRERQLLHQTEQRLKKKFTVLKIPTGSEICGKQLFNWADKIGKVSSDHPEIEKLLPEIRSKLAGLDREELIRRVVTLEFDRFLDDYRDGEDLIDAVPEKENRHEGFGGKGQGRSFPGNYKRLFINLGKADNFYPEQLIELINSNTKGKKIQLGRIDLMKKFSFFEVAPDKAGELIQALTNTTYMNRRVADDYAQDREGDQGENSEKRGGRKYRSNDRSDRSDNKRKGKSFRPSRFSDQGRKKKR